LSFTVTSDTNLQERVAGSKRGVEYVQDAQSYMEENSKYLKTDQAVKVRNGLTQACGKKEIPSVPHICYGIKLLTL